MDDSRQAIRSLVADAGAIRCGFAEARPVSESEHQCYTEWVRAGRNFSMPYLERYDDIRRDPRLLLDGARTVISCAFDYRQPRRHPLFADYALGRDYHDVIRMRLSAVADEIVARFGGNTRVCVDTAPIRERYWAAEAGVGIIGLNGQLIVDGVGSKVFLAEILWTGSVTPDSSLIGRKCLECDACVKACPGNALDGRGGLDAARCYSCLTIEHRGDLPPNLRLDSRIYGCDVCQDVCPMCSESSLATLSEFLPSDALMSLDADGILAMDGDAFRAVFGRSAVRRAKLSGLQRNAARHKNSKNQDF